MATEQEPSVDDWVLVNEDEEECSSATGSTVCDEEQGDRMADDEETLDSPELIENEKSEDSPELIENEKSEDSPELADNENRNETPELLNSETDSFSVISSLSDNFSYLSWYDNIMEDIIIESGKRCYAHFRNQKLNTSLNFVLTVAFTLVAGLAIGNFIGLTKNCEYEKHRLTASCVLNSSIGSHDVPDKTTDAYFIQEKISKKPESTPRKLIEKNFNSNVPGQFALLAFAMEDQFRNHPLITEGTSKSKEMTRKNNAEIQKTHFPPIFNQDWTLVVDASCNETIKAETVQDGANIHSSHLQSEEMSNMQSSLHLQNLEPMSLIQYLHDTVDEVMHRAIQLSLSLPTENVRSREDFVNIERTRKVIHKFIGLVKRSLNNLSKSVQSTDFKKKSANKYFFKITSGIIKSVDKLMKGVLKEALSRREAVDSRLRKIQGLFFEVIKKLQKNLEKDENLGFQYEREHSKKPDFYHPKYEEHKLQRYQKQRSNNADHSKDHKNMKLYFRNPAD